MSTKKIIFITGTDTGVGKSLITALLLHHLRQSGVHALAMKPFCSGGRADVRLLQALQPGELSDTEVNPFYFTQPVAPLVVMNKRNAVRLSQVVQRIRAVQHKCDLLLVEGSGGLMVPLGEGFCVADLIGALDCRVVVAARNRLGTINHTLLTINALEHIGIAKNALTVTLMSASRGDLSSQTNEKMISRLIRPIPVFHIPFLGKRANTAKTVQKHWFKLKKMLDGITGNFVENVTGK